MLKDAGKPTTGDDVATRQFTVIGRLRNYLITGVLVTAPIAITISLVWVLIDLVDGWVQSLLPVNEYPALYVPFQIPGSGVILTLAVLILIGWFAAGFLGKFLVKIGETIVARTPIIRSVYGALKQIFETVLAQQSNACYRCYPG
jgi:uncharacterized membrane protein